MVLALTACVQPNTRTPDVSVEDLQREEQSHMAMLDQQVVEGRRYTMLSRKKIFERLDRVAPRIQQQGKELCEALVKGQDCLYKFALKETRELNAYADGEKIYVTPAFVSFVENDEELAMVLAHEYAHNIMGHVQAQQTNALAGAILGAILDAAISSQGGGYGNNFSQAGANLGALSYSIPFEREADYVGLYIMANAGYNLDKGAGMWRRMTLLDGEDGLYGGVTHPSHPERSVSIRHTINEITAKKQAHAALVPELLKPQDLQPAAATPVKAAQKDSAGIEAENFDFEFEEP